MGYVVATYAIIWLVVFGYLGWIALRLRGARSELAAVEEQLRERERPGA
jgi:CcmD family protein